MNKNVKYALIGIGILFIIVIAVYGFGGSSNEDKKTENATSTTITVDKSENSLTTTVNTVTPKNTSTASKPVAKPVVKKPVVSKPAPQSYIDAAAKYKKSGYYIQFYPCQATPGSLIVKQGSKIMLDNRDSKAHSIGIKNDKYLIASYNYAIATLNAIGTNYVTCDGGGSATITVVP